MALFKKDTEEKKAKTAKGGSPDQPKADLGKEKVAAQPVSVTTDLSWVLHSPRMSEKAMYAADKNVYIFNIDPRANKQQIQYAIKEIYDVEPEKVNVSKIARKNVRNQRTGIRGVKSGGKKAYVYLKEGDKINIV